jgi:DNA-nicking Smr family endonuclease
VTDRRKHSAENPPDEERRLFEEEMRGVRRLDRDAGRVVQNEKPAPPPIVRPDPPDEPLAVETAGEHVQAFDPSLSPARRRALRQGRPQPDAVLDLHGLRAADAVRRVERFVGEARSAGHRRVLIITGRGLRSGHTGPVLREEIAGLLSNAARRLGVLGLVSAPPSLGGTGALLVLLRA